MARNRKEPKIKLQQPDRSGPDPSHQTLLDIAEQRGLLDDLATNKGEVGSPDEEALVGRAGDAILWSTSLTMVHFTLDVVVANQYAVDIEWPKMFSRTLQSFPSQSILIHSALVCVSHKCSVIFFLFYIFHPHQEPLPFLPRLFSTRIQPLLHQLLFFFGAVFAGSYLIHITNVHGYYAIMKEAPPIGTLWIWCMVELSLLWALVSLVCFGVVLKVGQYSVV